MAKGTITYKDTLLRGNSNKLGIIEISFLLHNNDKQNLFAFYKKLKSTIKFNYKIQNGLKQ